MYEWPLFSSLLGISTIFFFLSIVAILSFYNYGSFRSVPQKDSSLEYSSHQPLDLDGEYTVVFVAYFADISGGHQLVEPLIF